MNLALRIILGCPERGRRGEKVKIELELLVRDK